MNKAFATALVVLMFLLYFYFQSFHGRGEIEKEVLAGWRSSPYGYQQEGEPGYWTHAALNLSSRVNGTPSGVWVIGNVLEDGTCKLGFPGNSSYEGIIFSENDTAKKYLDAFDITETKIWLQVEPGSANVTELIGLVMEKYGNHSSVIGFGIDVEWLDFLSNVEGRAVADEEALEWLRSVRRYNQSYMMFLKHWKEEKMPSAHPEGLVLMQDAQDFGNYSAMMKDYEEWGKTFSNASVGYQFGYEIDRHIWSKMKDPFTTISDDILRKIPNAMSVYWVDFTIRDVFP